MQILTSGQTGLKMYRVDGREINSFVFYHDGKIVFQTRQGWFENYPSSRAMPGLSLKGTIRRSTKVNLTKGGHFYVNKTGGFSFNSKPPLDVYIDLAVGDVELGDTEQRLIHRDQIGDQFVSVRKLTAAFGTDTVQTIDVIVPGSLVSESSEYGRAIAEIHLFMEKNNIQPNLTPHMIATNDRLLDMIIKAKALLS